MRKLKWVAHKFIKDSTECCVNDLFSLVLFLVLVVSQSQAPEPATMWLLLINHNVHKFFTSSNFEWRVRSKFLHLKRIRSEESGRYVLTLTILFYLSQFQDAAIGLVLLHECCAEKSAPFSKENLIRKESFFCFHQKGLFLFGGVDIWAAPAACYCFNIFVHLPRKLWELLDNSGFVPDSCFRK